MTRGDFKKPPTECQENGPSSSKLTYVCQWRVMRNLQLKGFLGLPQDYFLHFFWSHKSTRCSFILALYSSLFFSSIKCFGFWGNLYEDVLKNSRKPEYAKNKPGLDILKDFKGFLSKFRQQTCIPIPKTQKYGNLICYISPPGHSFFTTRRW